ncbi:MAG TPA: PKD domain-containing protein [Candidatus Limnocylindrales bacterium]
MVEFALIVPVFLLLLVIAVDFGRLFYTYIQLNNIAREGAAYAAANPTVDNATLTTVAVRESNVQSQRGEGAITATATCAPVACASALGGTGAGNRVTVGASETFNFFTPLIGAFWPGGLTIGSSATATVAVYAAGGGTPPASCSTAPPVPTFTWQSPDKVNQPLLISVDASGAASLAPPCQNVTYEWDFGSASNASPPDPNDPFREGITQDYTYAGAGTFTVILTVTNAAGSTASVPQTITLGATTCNPPTAAFTVSPAAILDKKGNITNWSAANNGGNGATVFTFDGTSSGFMSDPACHPVWAWFFGDGTTASGSATPPSHTYAHAYAGTTVHVKLTVTNDAGTSSKTFDIPLS